MIEDEALRGQAADQFAGSWDLTGVDEDIVGEIEAGKLCNAFEDVFSRQKKVVGFVLNDMSDADKFGVEGELVEGFREVRGAEVHPPNDSVDSRLRVSEFEEPVGFLQGLACLNGDRTIDCESSLEGPQISREPVAMQGGICGDPRVLLGIVVPEVLVGV
jgi:hypothetical protein